MNSKTYDIAIIGGGIVGCATAMALSSLKNVKLILLEAESELARHQTGNNSGVIHSGLYYKPGSLKAKNCVEGRQALYQFCREHNIAVEQCGKLVIATDPNEIPLLDALENKGKANGLQGMKRLAAEELKEYEPHVSGVAGLYIRETGIVDYVGVTNKFADIVKQSGGEILTGARVTGFQKAGNELVLETTRGAIHAKNLVNCAGLQSDRVAKLCGIKPGLKIIPFRGEYYKLVPEKYHLVKNLIYPVPDPQFPFLGVHYTRMIHGGVEAGPNAVLAFKREGYKKTSFSFRDSVETFSYPGFWVLGVKYWKMGFGEMYRSFSKAAFVRALQKLIPELEDKDILTGGAGVRAQALEANGSLVDDFRIVEAEKMVHILNAPSPAATASISIGKIVAGIAAKDFHLN
ncbi:MAG: hydroxyglutarate oxidase [Caldithrix sp. RBG_13_44_9]|nr:MAG: hydroxyglutarate oxidase [Caldithrix sp. RBG_13_44_9]